MGSWMGDTPRFWHYRDKDQVEVDVIVEVGNKIWGVEVKAAASVSPSDGKGLLRLADVAGKSFQGGIVFYDGRATLPIRKEAGLCAVPISKLWEL